MGFKLIRLDSEESTKIPLKVGTHIIGRGSFLNCDDHRVSRRHGVIKVTESTVLLKSLHQNPCFYNKKKLKKTALLPQGKCVPLSNTDHFGLLPDTYWYEIIFCDNNNQLSNIPLQMDQDNRINIVTGDNQDKRETLNTDLNEETRALSAYNNLGSQEVRYQLECDEGSDSELLNLEYDETMDVDGGDESQSLLAGDPACDPSTTPPQDVNTESNDQSKGDETHCEESPAKRSHEPDSNQAKKLKMEPTSPEVNNEEREALNNKEREELNNEEREELNNEELEGLNRIEPQSVSEMAGSTSPIYEDTDSQNTTNISKQNAMDVSTNPNDINEQSKNSDTDAGSNYDGDTDTPSPSDCVKEEPKSPRKVKEEPLSPKDEKKDPETAKPGSSHDQAGSSNVGVAAPIPPAPRPPARERCIYGANCYRRNVQHKAQFSHPGDADYGAGPRGQCPYGAACRKREPRHWAAHDHPLGTRLPRDPPGAPLHPGNPVKKRRRDIISSESESDQDSPSPNRIVHGKRKRKPVRRESWSYSEEEPEDPYGTDESDEWVPPSNATSQLD